MVEQRTHKPLVVGSNPTAATNHMQKGVDHIGVTCVFYCHDGKGKFLLHKRSNNCRDEVGRWDCGGGALEIGESFEQAVRREIKEEYCVEPVGLQMFGVNNVIRKNGGQATHWVAILFVAEVDPRKVKIGEPKKMEKLGWFSKENFPKPLHSMLETHFNMLKDSGVLKING